MPKKQVVPEDFVPVESPRDLLLALMVEFSGDIRHGCHKVETEVSRSMAGKKLLAQAREALPMAEAFLRALGKPKNQLESGVQAGIAMLMGDLGNKLGLTPPQKMKYGDRRGWLRWARRLRESGRLGPQLLKA